MTPQPTICVALWCGVGTPRPNSQEDSTPDIGAERELMFNSRLLTHIAYYPYNEKHLAPNQFVLRRPYANLPPRVFQDSSYQLTQKSRKDTQKFVEHIWKRLLN